MRKRSPVGQAVKMIVSILVAAIIGAYIAGKVNQGMIVSTLIGIPCGFVGAFLGAKWARLI